MRYSNIKANSNICKIRGARVTQPYNTAKYRALISECFIVSNEISKDILLRGVYTHPPDAGSAQTLLGHTASHTATSCES
jgi:hypothetical protein